MEALEGILNDTSAEPIKLSYGLLKLITDNFSNKIGQGAFGVVYQGDLRNGLVAVKRSNGLKVTDKQFIDEIKCLKSTNHKNIVRFLGYCANTQEEVMPLDGTYVMAGERNRLFCFEYVSNGNIRQYLQQENPHGDDWFGRYIMIRGICHGLRYLHDNKINHLDLKPENIMLDGQMEPKITDFGLSRLLEQGQSTLVTKHIVGTLRYIAPEIIDKGEISFKADIYALGIIIIELLTGISLISLQNWDESLDMECPGMRKCTEIAHKCTQPDKRNGPTVHEVISDLDELESIIPRPCINQIYKRTVVMLPARSLTIGQVDNPHYWSWIPDPDFRFGQCVELLSVYNLKVSRENAPKDLPGPATGYTVYLVYKHLYKLGGSALKDLVQTASILLGQRVIATSKVSLHPLPTWEQADVTYPTMRRDGWLELRLGEFSNEGVMTIQLFHENPYNRLSDIIIKGMEVRSH